jgi:hypothetical protein
MAKKYIYPLIIFFQSLFNVNRASKPFNYALRMISSRVIRVSDWQCQCPNSPGFNRSILRHSGIGAADEAVLYKVL